jgi:hypothetical protein
MQIAELSPRPQSEWAERALELLPESLVHFMRRTRYRKIYGALAAELASRLAWIVLGTLQGWYDEGATEQILRQVESEILKLVAAKTPSPSSEGLEVAFGQAVVRRTLNVAKLYKATWGKHGGHVPAAPIDEDGEDEEFDPLEYVADIAPSPEARVILRETHELNKKKCAKALRRITYPQHRVAVRLHFLEGMPVVSSDPDEPTLVKYFNRTEATVRHWLHVRMKQMRKALGGEI